ncbi:MAG: hypothetical protein J5485_03960, partial [Candidatus Methanomethylophilaceae archaeon]|nr:hypothetical protein [Candidatus Methanomethylophilaceae archaeon]
MIGPDCHIVAAVHPIDPEERRDRKVRGAPIRIGNDVWLCANVTIVPGVTVGDGSVVGAGSVVTKDVPPGTVVAGNPARIIKKIRESNRDEASGPAPLPQGGLPADLELLAYVVREPPGEAVG